MSGTEPEHRGEEAARDSGLYQLVFENLEDHAVIVLDLNRNVLTWNPGAERLLGYTAEETIGSSADRIFTPEDIAKNIPVQEAAKALADGRAADNRWHVRKNGSRLWATGSMIRLTDRAGNVHGLAKVLQDQTALKLAEQGREEAEEALLTSQLRFRRLIEANIIGVGISSTDGSWIDANGELLRILGCDRDDLKAGRVRWDIMTPPEHRPSDDEHTAEANERGACTPYEKEFIRRDGQRIPVLTGYAVVSSVQGHYVCFVLDLSEQKKIEHELREADRRKDEFLAMLAHELRNPLAPIRTALEVLKHREAEPETIENARETMERQMGAMVRLVDDLLDVSRIMQDKVELKLEYTDLQSVIQRAVETSKPLIDAREHRLTVSVPASPAQICVDPVRISQAISNLLNNAAKYTETGGDIFVTAAAEEEHVRVSVQDTGTGIPAEARSRIFELFTQIAPTKARSQGGLGVGLTLVKRLVEMHGGTIEVESAGLGHGSTFTLRIPLREASGQSACNDSGNTTETTTGRPLSILVVDDNIDAATTLAMLLGLLGHQVKVAHTGQEGIEAVSDEQDLVLLDIGLPDMDGYDVAMEIRRRFSTTRPVIGAVTGYGQEKDRERSKAAGFDFHLVKPLNPSILIQLLGQLT